MDNHTPGPDEQLRYLRELVEATRDRASDLHPYLLVWGLVWVVGYTSTAVLGMTGDDGVWGVCLAAGAGGSALAGLIVGRRLPPPTLLARRLGWLSLLFTGLAVGGAPLFFDPGVDDARFLAWFPIVFGVMYAATGIFLGRLLVVVGVWLVIASAASMALPLQAQAAWLAAAGGGTLLGAGIVLRRTHTRLVSQRSAAVCG